MRLFLTLVAAITLSGCVQHTKVVKPLNDQYQGVLNIKKVAVAYSDLSSEKIIAMDDKRKLEGEEQGTPNEIQHQPLKDVFSKIALDSLEDRDGNEELFADIEIEVDNLKLANPLAAVLISDTDQLSGSVRVIDSGSKELLTEFYVDVLKGTGGLLGLAIRGGGVREKLSAQFSEYIGDQLGFSKADNKVASNTSSDEDR